MLKRLGVAAALLFAASWLLAASPAMAQDWSMDSRITQRGSYNSNLLLNPDNEVETFGSLTIPQFELQRVGPTSKIQLDGQFKFAEYINHSELNSDAQIIDLDVNKAFSERTTFAFNGAFDRDTTTTSDEDISGRFLNDTVRFTKWDASPSLIYQLSPIDKLSLVGNYEQKFYDSNQKTDYRYYGGTVWYERQISELASVLGSTRFTRYHSLGDQRTTSNSYGFLAGYKYKPTERFSLLALGGADYRTVDGQSGGDVGFRVNFDMGYDLNDQTKLKLILSHDSEPSGDGNQVVRTRGTLRVTYKLNEMTRLNLDGDYVDNQDYFGNGGGGSQSDEGLSRYYALKPSIAYNITEELNVALTYQFRYKVFDSQGTGTAIDNGAFLSFSYALPDLTWSGF
jgi:hypothetical protein